MSAGDWPAEIDWRIRRYSLGTATLELPLVERRVSSASHRALRKIIFRGAFSSQKSFTDRTSLTYVFFFFFFLKRSCLSGNESPEIYTKIHPLTITISTFFTISLFYIVLKSNLFVFFVFRRSFFARRFLWIIICIVPAISIECVCISVILYTIIHSRWLFSMTQNK